jgi:putative transposase
VIRTPVRAPRTKAHAERWVGSLRRECLDRIPILGRRHLEQVVRAYIGHHNEHRTAQHVRARVGEPGLDAAVSERSLAGGSARMRVCPPTR